ncbi:MAG: STAS/SEC14 domain-containing protein, partial [Microcystis sp.]
MPTIKIQAQLSKEDLLEAVEQLSLSELEGFFQDIISLTEKHHSPILSCSSLPFTLNQQTRCQD